MKIYQTNWTQTVTTMMSFFVKEYNKVQKADKSISLNKTVKYDISSNSLLFKKDFGPIYYTGRFWTIIFLT